MACEFYAIAINVANLRAITAAGESNLSIQPHPNEFHEAAEMVGYSGTGRPIELGYPQAVWTYDVPITPAEWKELMDFTGAAASATVWIRTRTNQMQASGEYEYLNYSCVMERPTGETVPPYRYENVSIKFTRLVLV